VLDAYANGLFGRDSHGLCAQQLGQWIAEMEDTVGFREAQIDRWATAIRGKIPGEDYEEQYPYLKKYSTNWDEVRQTLNNAAMHGEMHDYLRNVFEQPTTNVQELKKALDELLNSLVTNYDTAELPLRKQKRFADLVVQEKGDEAEASRLFDAEQSAFDEITDVTQLLTDAAMNPELVHASTATQAIVDGFPKKRICAAPAPSTTTSSPPAPALPRLSARSSPSSTASSPACPCVSRLRTSLSLT
jgi:hypothetical protein